MYVVIQPCDDSLHQPSTTSTFRCLDTIADTLRKVDPGEVSEGTLYCLQSNVLHVMSSIKYSSYWSTESQETILPYLELGQRYLQEFMQFDVEREKHVYLLKQCIRALTSAIEQWRSLGLAHSITLRRKVHVQYS